MDWVKAYLRIWSELQAYIKEYHTTGLTWSKTVTAEQACGRLLRERCWSTAVLQQVELVRCLSSCRLLQGPVATEGAKAPSVPPAAAAPPPPGPPPPPAPSHPSSGADDSATRSALFAQINRGEGITSGKWRSRRVWGRGAASGQNAVLSGYRTAFLLPSLTVPAFTKQAPQNKRASGLREAGSQEQP